MSDLRRTSCTTVSKDILRQAFRPPYISATNARHTALFADDDLGSVWCALKAVLASPFKVDDNAQDINHQSSVLVTHLTRLDEARTADPRDQVTKNQFHVASGTFGNIWTTRPIAEDSWQEEKYETRSEGGSSHDSRCTAKVVISRFDLGWRRKKRKYRSGHKEEEEQLFADDSDVEQDAGESGQPAAMGQPALRTDSKFYSSTDLPARRTFKRDVDLDPLMLLRLGVKLESEVAVAAVKRTWGRDDRPLKVVKRTNTGKSAVAALLL